MAAHPKRLALIVVAVVLACGAGVGGLAPGPQGTSVPPSGASEAPERAVPSILDPRPRGSRPQESTQRRPARIVSLVPAVTEMLFAMGAGDQVIAVSTYDNFPPAAKTLPRVGALLDPNVERILSLRPELVVVYGSQTDLQMQLERAGLGFISYRHGGIAGIVETIRDVAAATGRQAEAGHLVREIQSRLAQIRARVRGRSRPRTVLVFERDPSGLSGLFVSGGQGFLHDMLELAGGVNVFADIAREAAQPSLETLLARAPEVVIEIRATGLLANAGAGVDPARVWARLASVPAVRNGRVHLLNGDYLVVAGPRVAEATEALARVLHPDAFR